LFVASGNTFLGGTLSATGNANVGNIGAANGVFTNVSGNGSTLTSITGASVTGQVGNALIAGTVYTNAQPNITSVGTLTGLGVNGTITGVNITANTGVFTGNANGISSVQAANIVGTTLSSTVVSSSLTAVGTLTSLSSSGNVTGANIIATTYDITGVATGIAAAGTVQANATVIAKAINVVSTVATGAGVVFPVAVAGMRLTIMNTSANSLLVYPNTSGIINSLAANGAYTLTSSGRLDFVAVTTTQWYTLNATYG
jgi:hypothetical protein